MKNIFMFSGQGSQYYHMGHELRKHQPLFAQNINRLASIVYHTTGCHILDIIYNPNKQRYENFSDSRLSNIALLTIECAMAESLIQENIFPHSVCGMSLGEYTAAVVANILDFETAIYMVANAGTCFDDACSPGGMLAILGEVDIYHENTILNRSSEIAFDSQGKHFVISGELQKINLVEDYLRQKQVTTQRLSVAYGYHSKNIDPAKKSYSKIINDIPHRRPNLPFISTVDGEQITHLGENHFWRTAREPIRFIEAIDTIKDIHEYRFIDLGPSGTMTSLLRSKINPPPDKNIYPVITPFNDCLKNYSKILSDNRLELLALATHIKKAWVFPGQGSLKMGVGVGLFKRYPNIVARADKILGYSIEKLCLEDPKQLLSQVQYNQSAMFVINALYYHDKLDSSSLPNYMAGHGIGEYNALYAAGGIDFESMLRLVKNRETVMAQVQRGAMVVIIGMSEHRVSRVIQKYRLSNIAISCINSPKHIVISGLKESILAAKKLFEFEGCDSYIRLNVTGAFHTSQVTSILKSYTRIVYRTKFNPLKIPVVANQTGLPYKNVSIADTLAKQIISPVRWLDTVKYMHQCGVKKIEEVGPGNVLSTLISACEDQTYQNKIVC